MRKAALTTHEVREPRTLLIRIITEFEPQHHYVEPKPDQVLARLFLYTREAVFQGTICKKDLNSQLAWSETSMNTLVDSLSGRRDSIDIRFDVESSNMILVCEIESKIRITLFSIELERLEEAEPLGHMKEVFLGYRKLYLEQQNKMKQEKDKIDIEIKEIGALCKQVEEQAQTEIQHMKTAFVDVVNQCKKQLRKHMKTGILELNDDHQEQDQQQPHTRRTIVRVNREALESQVYIEEDRNNMEIQEKNGFQNLF